MKNKRDNLFTRLHSLIGGKNRREREANRRETELLKGEMRKESARSLEEVIARAREEAVKSEGNPLKAARGMKRLYPEDTVLILVGDTHGILLDSDAALASDALGAETRVSEKGTLWCGLEPHQIMTLIDRARKTGSRIICIRVDEEDLEKAKETNQ